MLMQRNAVARNAIKCTAESLTKPGQLLILQLLGFPNIAGDARYRSKWGL